MIDILIDIVSWLFIVSGGVLCIIGGIGLIRLPDVFTRMHGAGIVDTLGAGLILLGLVFQAGFTLVTGKLLLILLFVFFTSPTASHAVARAALNDGMTPLTPGQDDGEKIADAAARNEEALRSRTL